jgi:L-ascorbate metabolism protein UlaG (beta-lactamase superfamily)
MNITYYGHDAFVVESGGTRIIIDPFLSGQEDTSGKIPDPGDIEVSYILLTHAHQDHFGDTLAIAKKNNATVIAPFEVAMICQTEGCKVHAMHIGGGFNFDFGRVKLTIAHHGSGYQTASGIVYGGNPCGILLTMGGKTLYHAGDTGLFLDMKLIGEMNSIDAALLPIGDNFTMGIDDAVKAVTLLSPALAVPMHFNTFPVIEADPNEFVQKVESLGKKGLVMELGETIEV